MAWITDEDLLQRLLDRLQKAEMDTEGAWDTIITDANRWAHGEIVSALAGRGYTMSQINAWTQRQDYNVDLAIFWALTNAGTTKSWDQRFIDKLDRRKELMTVKVVGTDGELVVPGGTSNSVKVVPLKDADDAVFTAKKMKKW